MAVSFDRARLAPLKDAVAVVGVGETDYGKDYRGAGGQAVSKGEARYDSYTLASRALKRALDDAGLKKDDIDGLCVGGTLSGERASEQWGLNPRWSGGGDAAQCIIEATLAINAGLCTTVALVYGNAQRSMDTAYGGARVTGGAITSYFYYAPWGMTSQGALYALFFQRHKLLYGTTDEQLGAVAVAFRKHACLNPNAVMQKPLTIQDYLNAPYIAEPLRLNDYCLINDGGVAIIVRRADLARDLKQRPVMVSGFGWSEENVDATQLRPRLKTFYHSAHHDVAAQVYPMAGVTPKDVDVFATYDSFSVHLLASLEGFGFCKEGEAGTFVQGGRIEIGGELPCNTSGGMLSESYMQSWNHQPELVRQLRGGLGNRQVQGAEVAQYVHDVAGKCKSLIYTRRA
jgi:acetyl-CoA acetyltransferase